MACIFCALLVGEAPARFVAQEELAAAFLPLSTEALAPGHTLVVPREHARGVQDVSPRGLAAAMLLVQRVSNAMESALGADGVCVLNASGPGSGQTVNHLHFHVVPHWADDEYYAWPENPSPRTSLEGAGVDVLLRAGLGEHVR